MSNRRVRVSGRIARTGVQAYMVADSVYRGEHRPTEEVFHPASMASWVGAPVVVGHVPVDARNVDSVAVGYVVDVRRDGRFIAATLALHDADAIARVRTQDLVEISCGYAVELDPASGVNEDGEEYHAVQRNIRGDHVALGPRNWARCGPECKLSP